MCQLGTLTSRVWSTRLIIFQGIGIPYSLFLLKQKQTLLIFVHSRSQDEKFQQQSVQLDVLPEISLKLLTVSNKVDDVEKQMKTLDNGFKSLQDKGSHDGNTEVLNAIEKMEDVVRNISRR